MTTEKTKHYSDQEIGEAIEENDQYAITEWLKGDHTQQGVDRQAEVIAGFVHLLRKRGLLTTEEVLKVFDIIYHGEW